MIARIRLNVTLQYIACIILSEVTSLKFVNSLVVSNNRFYEMFGIYVFIKNVCPIILLYMSHQTPTSIL